MFKSIVTCVFFFLHKSPVVEWLNHVVGVCLTFKETAKLFPKVVVLYLYLGEAGGWLLGGSTFCIVFLFFFN